ncbi:UDP-Glycosyltransferase/glycogen phosphorylase [Ascodesmis nigricans]|uniref:GDP-Man:Man(3)GlcNAc(2)-PP-Dol alpha-1,2-mannosyltransferase n=1 Tax=Ascodesmis nigricans TaxID=341454 RepID=A0A4S2N5C4_9PEZI|nr:UDP-Glycosyltransferase/glycogen phosphorylase [Ascodesmis nigricans]
MASILTTALTAIAGPLVVATVFYYVLFGALLRLVGAHLRSRTAGKREAITRLKGDKAKIVGFFHPYCNAGGGGERVLWAAVFAVQQQYPSITSVVYTGDHDAPKADIIRRVKTRFSIALDPDRLEFIYLMGRRHVAASTWPHFTLLGQSIGSLLLAWEAFTLLVPDVFIDTMGYAFTLPLAKSLLGIPTAAYVHYPTISTDMLGTLSTDSSLRTKVKRYYWLVFAELYSRCGKSIDRIMVNSSWTANHIRTLWKRSDISVVFPPCAVGELMRAIPADNARQKIFLCIAQFRPEKNHTLIIEAFAKFYHETVEHKDAKLVLVGSVRHSDDATRVYNLRILARELGVKDQVQFVTDAPWEDVLGWLKRSWAGVNGMWNEHFGIGVVEYQAAGLIGIVHDSGGPKLDIVVEGTGFHCTTKEEFAEAFEKVLSLPEDQIMVMRTRARQSARRFDETTFDDAWQSEFKALMELESKRKG